MKYRILTSRLEQELAMACDKLLWNFKSSCTITASPFHIPCNKKLYEILNRSFNGQVVYMCEIPEPHPEDSDNQR